MPAGTVDGPDALPVAWRCTWQRGARWRAKATKEEIEFIIAAFDKLSEVATIGTIDVPVKELDATLANLRSVLAHHQARLAAATNEAQRHFIKIDIQAVEAEMARLQGRLDSLIGPAFEQLGRQGAAAFERGFRPELTLPSVTRGVGGGA